MYVPNINQTGQYPPMMNPYWPYTLSPPMIQPIIKNFNINTIGPMADHSKISAIYEDVLPTNQSVSTSNTLGERINIYNFVRSVFIKHSDGEDIDLNGNGQNSLLSYLKFLDLNPYNTNQFSKNPYKGLPDDMLIYRSCYPIRYDEKTGGTQCAPNSIGMNVRIYKMTFGEYYLKKQQTNNYNDFNLWRELAFYEYVREQILKRKISPNFPMLYAYYICENCNIDFNKLALIKGKVKLPENQMITKVKLDCVQIPIPISINLNQIKYVQAVQPRIKLNSGNIGIDLEANMNAYSGRAIVALTEAPTYNLYSWASRTYQSTGTIKRMINTGYHQSPIWYSVLFQLMTAMYVLQLNSIAFKDFTIEDNVYIKDLSPHDNITTYWKYKIDGLDYYVPNYGYLVMIDTNYKDVENTNYTLIKQNAQPNYKIYTNFFGNIKYDEEVIKNMNFVNFKNIFNINSFTKSFTNYGGSKPPEDIVDLLNKINNDATSGTKNPNIGYYIQTYMTRLLNNRIGTYLNQIEFPNVRKDDAKPFYKGQIVVQEVQHETYKFVTYMEQTGNQVKILTKEDARKEDIIEKNVPRDTLYNYSRYDNIVQIYKPLEANLNEEDLLETYIIDK